MDKIEHDYIRMSVRCAVELYRQTHYLCAESDYLNDKSYEALIDYVAGKIADVGSLSGCCNMSVLTYIDIVYSLMRGNQNFYDDVLYNNESENDRDMFLQDIFDKYDVLGHNLALAFEDNGTEEH